MDYNEWFEKMFIKEARAAVESRKCSGEDVPVYEGEVEVN